MNIKTLLQKGLILLISICYMASLNTVFAQIQERKVDTSDLLYKFETVDDEGKQVTSGTTTDYIANLPEGSSEKIIANIIFYVLIVANILAFASFVVAAVYMLISQGNEEDLSHAKRMFTYTVIAMIVCATALAFVTGITKLQLF